MVAYKWTRCFSPGSGILSDAIGCMNGEHTRWKYPEKVRHIVYWDDELKWKFIFFTNALDISQMTVAELRNNCWRIELFFKLGWSPTKTSCDELVTIMVKHDREKVAIEHAAKLLRNNVEDELENAWVNIKFPTSQ